MPIDYPVPGAQDCKASRLTRERNNIELIKQKLVNIGYSSGEIEYLVQQFAGKAKIKDLSVEDLRSLKESLQYQLELAKKCLEIP
ncbi:hypothetical protein SPSYN_00816 [Sporotomaculum syntrophicum]|uniref:Uncharacterized protein n=1 Tax=Sporotomaculum syntrophicum TaxID=182264 RepID=A0A9D2WRL4_9FIRM|nr:hypothetical protein [Sporotomaculum syntrophicum]KAF1086078.1 hypothetical protein SPSYN_00816 [Sporotomaculum syntrophicum]